MSLVKAVLTMEHYQQELNHNHHKLDLVRIFIGNKHIIYTSEQLQRCPGAKH
uniref:Uncharacterized protein n=1 Tax=Octopus bimaculoides TaxID=37653 RepID=A0A0L8FPR5_OCTBM